MPAFTVSFVHVVTYAVDAIDAEDAVANARFAMECDPPTPDVRDYEPSTIEQSPSYSELIGAMRAAQDGRATPAQESILRSYYGF